MSKFLVRTIGTRRGWVIFVLLNIIMIGSASVLLYGPRPEKDAAFETLMESAASQDISRYYGRLLPGGEEFTLAYNAGGNSKEWCVRSAGSGATISPSEICGSKKVVIDRHAASSLVLSSFSLKGVLLSEFITGHIKLEGVTVGDVFRWLA